MAAKGKKELIQILATKYNLPLKEVEKVVNSQFKPGRLKYLNDAKRKSIKNNRQSKD